MKKLNSWVIESRAKPESFVNDPFNAPETKENVSVFTGIVSGHPDFKEGDRITTSAVKNVSKTEEGVYVMETSSGSIYELGSPLEDYEKLYPNAIDRLVNVFN